MEEKKFGLGRVLGYGIGSMGKDLALGVIGSYLLAFYTDVFGISAAAAGIILVVTKIWDAVNDPMMGALVDRSKRTKWGKYRPYILIIPIPLAVFSVLCFLSPEMSMAGKIAYAAITYTITGMLFTAYDVPLWGMLPSLSRDMNVRNKLIASARTFTTLAMLIASAAAMPAIIGLGGGEGVENLRVGYPRFMIILGVASVIFAWITFFSTKEVVVEDESVPKKKSGLFKEFASVLNKPLIIVLVAMIFNAMTMILPSVSGVYYMMYYMMRPDMIAVYMMISMGMGLVTSILAPVIMKRVEPKKLTIFAFALSSIVGVLVFFIGRGSLPLLFVLFAVAGMCTGILMVSITTLLTMTADHIARKKGKRVDGTVFAMNSFAIKVGQAIASGLVSVILVVTNYIPNSFEQSEAALTGILASRSILPAVLGIIGLIVVLAFRLPKED